MGAEARGDVRQPEAAAATQQKAFVTPSKVGADLKNARIEIAKFSV